MIEAFQFIKGINTENYKRFFKLSSVRRTRGYKGKLAQGKFHTEVSKNFFYTESSQCVQ